MNESSTHGDIICRVLARAFNGERGGFADRVGGFPKVRPVSFQDWFEGHRQSPGAEKERGEFLCRAIAEGTLTAKPLAEMMIVAEIISCFRSIKGKGDPGMAMVLYWCGAFDMLHQKPAPRVPEEVKREVRDFMKEAGRRGGKANRQKWSLLRAWAVERYRAGTWQSPSKAARGLKEEIIDHGRTIDVVMTQTHALRTITDWFKKAS
ncbi:hypothetical protein AGMMS49960_17720 [Betaproteobacteria bacterium]|nr:hypothetical protein AGMMS49543_03730 [Betaproteobacteria bacterium]GHU03396.1 hypothetical protein AGMMS49960_17720 [Betaproteobacteria bacterium]GHU17821.1 hypothetical protein AGMMS50243_06700 [Betaproteobacteria bacterium]